MKGSSSELQDVCMSALEKYPSVLTKCSTEIKEDFFDNPHYKLIYKCLREHYEKYLAIPSFRELALLLRERYSVEYGKFEEILETLDKVHNMTLTSEDFAINKSAEFIRRCKSEKALNVIVKNVNSNGEINLDNMVDSLNEALSFNFTLSEPFNLADVNMIKKIKQEELGTEDSPRIIKLFINDLNYNFAYKGLTPGTLNCVAACPGCGKSMFLVNQGLASIQQGYKVLHVVLGDLSKLDIVCRYLACLTGVKFELIVGLSAEELAAFVKKHNMSGFLSNLDVVVHAEKEMSTNQVIDEVRTIQRAKNLHYDEIIIDYDENLSDNNLDDMYKSGGDIYNKLAGFAKNNRSVVWIASQISREFWKYEIPPLESLAQSSNKQKVLDLMLTIGKPSKSSSVLTLYVAKNRRGEECKIYRIKFEGHCCRLSHISEEEYETTKKLDKMNGGVTPVE